MPKFPFIERRIGSDHLLRYFSSDTDSDELAWHRDRNARHVRVLEGAGWSLQLDDQLPESMRLGESYVIPAGGWHRLIRSDNATNLCVIIREEILDEKKRKKKESKPHPREYGAVEGSPRAKQLDQTKADLESGDSERIERAYNRRERMEKKEREKPSFENKPRPDTKSESVYMDEEELRALVREALSKKTKATLRKKAEKRGLTPGSVEAEYKKGLAAWATSGSRKGMSQHQWAMARVNSANPSKDWAVVKKSKAKKNK